MAGKNFDRCWEHMRCGEERTCGAYPDNGEKCWEVAGTMRSNEAERRLEKQAKLAREEGRDLTEQELLQFNPTKAVKLCKFIDRFGSCRCCPYFLFVEKMQRSMTKFKGEAF
ncbi:MAG: hypothetical protein PHO30_07415 [Candidatus Omnitrophica bacterium]|jgi:hypothetical protein|nr:hypothetical protein [Candidatus Omnitrophota bacterium]